MTTSKVVADKNSEVSLYNEGENLVMRICHLFEDDLILVASRELFEKIYEVLEINLYDEDTNNELYEKLVEKELLLEQAQSQIQSLEDRIEFLQR
ncbi:hypothetical protein ACTQ4K_00265 [Clostridium sporogenes]|uniref:hypothetical protein n=1 Tax=Clostridium sporogenes TaxID=1509 RepID=UPI003F936391